MICPKCGKMEPDDVKFCGGCGEKLAKEGVDTGVRISVEPLSSGAREAVASEPKGKAMGVDDWSRPRKGQTPKMTDQLGILVLDGSGSMREHDVTDAPGMSRAEAVAEATKGLIERLSDKGSWRSQDFSIALIAFDDEVEIRLDPTPVNEIELDPNKPAILHPTKASLDPSEGLGGRTAIGKALKTAGKMAEKFLQGQTKLERSVVIVLLTDGGETEDTDPTGVANPIRVANEIKTRHGGKRTTQERFVVDLYCVAFGNEAGIDVATLKAICRDPKDGFTAERSKEALRRFFDKTVGALGGV